MTLLTSSQVDEVQRIVRHALDVAEVTWNRHSTILMASESARLDSKAKSLQTQIPGYPEIEVGEEAVDEFIAIVADMRGSTSHLMSSNAPGDTLISGLQRIYYETSALLPSLGAAIVFSGGSVTEYLGDGVLGLYQVSKPDGDQPIYSAYWGALLCLDALNEVVNPEIVGRYGLPAIEIGVGLARSMAIVAAVGHPESAHPKAIGECVWRATKLSGAGAGAVFVDEQLRRNWPTSDTGKLRFLKQRIADGLEGYKAMVD